MSLRRVATATLAAVMAAVPLSAQSATDWIARGDSLHDALHPSGALEAYKTALSLQPGNVDVLWRAARSQVDVAKQALGDHEFTRRARDSAYAVARAFADRALAADSTMADVHYVRALVLGQLSRTRSGRERVSFAREIYDAAARALMLDPDHGGAHHVLGAWHAEVKRLSGLTRFFAKTFLGAGFFDRAHWDSAAAHLERAVELNPAYLYHRLELAEIYVDMDRHAQAREQLRAISGLADSDVLDWHYRERAAQLLADIADR